jgi:hypothetical protein
MSTRQTYNKPIWVLVSLILSLTVTNATYADDHGDTFETATLVSVGSATPGVIDVQGDLDYFKFTVTQTATY